MNRIVTVSFETIGDLSHKDELTARNLPVETDRKHEEHKELLSPTQVSKVSLPITAPSSRQRTVCTYVTV